MSKHVAAWSYEETGWGDRGLCFLVECQRGDPTSALYVGRGVAIVGTMLGRVIGFLFGNDLARCDADDHDLVPHIMLDVKLDQKLHSGTDSRLDSEGPYGTSLIDEGSHHVKRGRSVVGRSDLRLFNLCKAPDGGFQLYTAFSDDAIKMLHVDEERIFAVVGNSQSRSWRRTSPPTPDIGFKFDRRITSTYKYALSGFNSPEALIVTPGITVLVNIAEETQHLVPFKLPDKDIVPVDFDCTHHRLALYFHRMDDQPCVKVFSIPSAPSESLWGLVVQPVFQEDMPKTRTITKIKFWGDGRLVVVVSGIYTNVFDLNQQTTATIKGPIFTLRGHTRDVVAVEGSRNHTLLTLGKDRILNVWRRDGSFQATYDVKPATFRIGFPYFISRDADDDNFVGFTSDTGLYVMNLRLAEGRKLKGTLAPHSYRWR
eukprot:Lankesteria_metandrocarpae@DN7254_c0_g1_i1.p1